MESLRLTAKMIHFLLALAARLSRRLDMNYQEAAAPTPTTVEPVPVQVQAEPIGIDVGDTALIVPVLDGATEADDRSDHALLGVGLVIVPSLGEIRQADVAMAFDFVENFLRGGFVVELEIAVNYLCLTTAPNREMLRMQVVGHEDVLITLDTMVSRIIVVDQRLAELTKDESLQVVHPRLRVALTY